MGHLALIHWIWTVAIPFAFGGGLIVWALWAGQSFPVLVGLGVLGAGVSYLCVLAALGYSQVKTDLPKTSAVVPTSVVSDWLLPGEAAKKFLPTEFAVFENAKAKQMLAAGAEAEAQKKYVEAQDIMTRAQMGIQPDPKYLDVIDTRAIELLGVKWRDAQKDSEKFIIARNNSENAVLQLLHNRLRKRELLGRGHLVRGKPGAAEPIEASMWAYLKIDLEKNCARGNGVEFVGVEISDGA